MHAGAGGDVTFAIDGEAESYLERFLAERAPEVAFYSEDRGLVLPGDPPGEDRRPADLPARDRRRGDLHAEDRRPGDLPADRPPYVLVVDPIDGTRPAL